MIKRKDGLWQQAVTVTVRGRKTRKYFYGHTKAEVNRKIAAWKEEQERGRGFDAVCAEWQKEHFPHIAEGTKVCYRPAIERAVSFFGAQPVREIAPLDIQRALGLMARQGYAHQSVKIYLSVINQVLNYAVLMGDADTNPAAVVHVPKGLERNRRDTPTEEELETIRSSLHTARFGLFAFLLLNTGLRRGEALALQWRDIDFANRLIRVQKSIYYTGNQPHLKEPKTESGIRSVILTDSLYTAIYPVRGPQDEYLFGGEKPLTQCRFRTLWGQYCVDAGLYVDGIKDGKATKIPTITPHQLRHAYATLLFEAGITVKDAQALLGHSKAEVTMDVYTHVREQHMDAVARKLNRIV